MKFSILDIHYLWYAIHCPLLFIYCWWSNVEVSVWYLSCDTKKRDITHMETEKSQISLHLCAWKRGITHMQTAKAQLSLHICTVWSEPVAFWTLHVLTLRNLQARNEGSSLVTQSESQYGLSLQWLQISDMLSQLFAWCHSYYHHVYCRYT